MVLAEPIPNLPDKQQERDDEDQAAEVGALIVAVFVAREIAAARLEVHHTPKHGSWLNMAELELSVLARRCLRQRLPDRTTMERHVTTWATRRNAAAAAIAWQFTTADARTNLRRLYPTFDA